MSKLGVAKMEDNKYDKYAVEDAANTLMKAHEHMADPVMMKHVGSHIAKKKHAIDALHKKTKPKTTNDLRKIKAMKDDEAMEKAMGKTDDESVPGEA